MTVLHWDTWAAQYSCVALHAQIFVSFACEHCFCNLTLGCTLFNTLRRCRTLEVLQDQVEPGSVQDVAEVLQRELGAPACELFAEFEPEARAAASLAQVFDGPPCTMGKAATLLQA